MALKDLKSDLSKFRRPVEKPLIEKKRVDVPKSSNQTPLSQFVDSTPNAPKSQTTSPKQGVTPAKFDNSSNFLGETTQNQFDNSSKFMGETSPSQFDNSSNYLGETTPTQMSLKERFLGQTEPNTVQQGDKFKGETKTANITQGDRFKGETTPQDYSNAEKFKGETSPSEFKFVKQYLGETTPTNTSLSAKFLGETTTTNVEQGDKFKGETTPTPITSNPNLEKQAKDPSYVDFIKNDDGRGFLPFLQPMSKSKFVGVDPSQTKFDEATSLYALTEPRTYEERVISRDLFTGFFDSDSKYDFTDPNQYGVSRDLDNGLGKTYTSKVLKDVYNKYNLKEDSYNTSTFKQPFILSGIQRKKGEPQTLGIGSLSLIRSGAVTATERAAIDAVRMGEFLLTPRGISWVVKQVGMQRSQRWGKTFTPVNLLSNMVSQHLGLRWDRPGVQPIGDETWKYDSDGYLSGFYEEIFRLNLNNDNLPLRVDSKGGFDSFYGIGITTTKRYTNTFTNPAMTRGDKTANFIQKYFPFGGYDAAGGPKDFGYGSDIEKDKNGNVVKQTQENSPIPIDTKFEERGLYKSEGLIVDIPDIADYEAISYGTISKLANGDTPENYKGDFRNLKGIVFNNGVDENGNGIEAVSNYKENNFRKTYGFGQTFKTNVERLSDERLDKVGLLKPNDGDKLNYEKDIVILGFKTDNSNRTQFRGTVSGITETFSPSWNSEKPNGRADKVYMYSEFERTLSFNFKAVAYSRMELIPMWEKLKQLATFAMPKYGSSSGYRGRSIQFTLGDLWKDHTALITSLSYTMSDEAAWEIDTNYTIPKLVDISVGLTLVGDAVHNENSTSTLYDYGV
jgi:hypothetical protein